MNPNHWNNDEAASFAANGNALMDGVVEMEVPVHDVEAVASTPTPPPTPAPTATTPPAPAPKAPQSAEPERSALDYPVAILVAQARSTAQELWWRGAEADAVTVREASEQLQKAAITIMRAAKAVE